MRIILSCKQSFSKFPDTQTDCVLLLFLLFPSDLSEGNLHFRPAWLGSLHVASSRRWIFFPASDTLHIPTHTTTEKHLHL